MFGSSSFGQGTGPVVFSGLSCSGTESSPADCTQSTYTYHFSRGNDIGVRCLQKGLYAWKLVIHTHHLVYQICL